MDNTYLVDAVPLSLVLRGEGLGVRGAFFAAAAPSPPSPLPRVRGRGENCRRPGFTVLEVTVALAVLIILGVIVAQTMFWSLRERARLTAHQAANELAANVLEEARAQPWDKLDAAWAESRTVPSEMADLLPAGKIIVKLEPGATSRRITVEVRWQLEQEQSVSLTTLLSARESKISGGTP
jgi:type II secretory pathway pseudopilin PulG